MNIKAVKIIFAFFILLAPLVFLLPAQKTFAKGMFYVDAGLFESFSFAWARVKGFSENGFIASIEKTGSCYRVYLGPYESYMDADNNAKNASHAGLISGVAIIAAQDNIMFVSFYPEDIIEDKKNRKYLSIVENSARPLNGLNKIDDKEMALVAAAGVALGFLDYGVLEEDQNLFGHNAAQVRLFELDKDGVGTSIYNPAPKTTALYTDMRGGHVQISDHFLIVDGDGILTPAEKLSGTRYEANYTLYDGLYYNTALMEWEGALNLETFFNDYYVYVPGNGVFYIDNFFLDLEFSYQTPLMYINGAALELDDMSLAVNKLSLEGLALGYVGYDTAAGSFTHNKGASAGALDVGNMSLGVAASIRGR